MNVFSIHVRPKKEKEEQKMMRKIDSRGGRMKYVAAKGETRPLDTPKTKVAHCLVGQENFDMD